ncbi:MAG TPA: NADH-quinone oxidoreductase subunit L [Bacteroidota bacterium]|nr:NADH-quinone oxidoreductase subunit L [Bacteroidota bacterium]
MTGAELTGLAVLLPLAGFLLNGLLGAKLRSEALSGIAGSGAVAGSFCVACTCFVQLLGLPPGARTIDVPFFPWIAAGGLHADVAFQVDQLSVVMMLIVTGVGFLIHVYSIGYMHGDPGFARFFAYLNLFIVAMLILILADNFLLMFLGWEGVGLCSYLLIGFWYDRKFEKGTTADAAKKAFVVNRIGDFGFLVGMFLIFVTFGSLRFQTVFSQAAALQVGAPVATLITLALFLGATGKSAQIPLFVWLPDAMAGPTPVSALIHAATMVTAGVYMVARCSVLYALAPASMAVVAVVGAATALMAATIGLVQNDIKKVLAYSTISQLGYMFLALGVGAFSAGIFHVMTHAFFKALLFLGSGAVIHAMHDEQDIRRMGGLRSALPVTFWTFLAGTLAIAGIPPLAGFFSKDEILWNAFARGSWVLWLAGVAGAGLTALYMFRLVALVFTGEPRWEKGTHPHEAPPAMTVPLLVLALLSAIGGFAGLPESLGGSNAFERWLEPVFAPAAEKMALVGFPGAFTEYLLMAVSVAVALAGTFLAYAWYTKRTDVPGALVKKFSGIYRVLLNKYYVDEVYDGTVVRPAVKIADTLLWKGVDVAVIDGIVNGLARAAQGAGDALRRVQTGVARNYILVFLTGAFLLVGWLLVR